MLMGFIPLTFDFDNLEIRTLTKLSSEDFSSEDASSAASPFDLSLRTNNLEAIVPALCILGYYFYRPI